MFMSIRSRLQLSGAAQLALIAALLVLVVVFRDAENRSRQAMASAQQAQTSMQALLRGLGDVMITEGSSSSLASVKESTARVGGLLQALTTESMREAGGLDEAAVKSIQSQWAATESAAKEFVSHKKYSLDDVPQMTAYGRLSAAGTKLAGQLDIVVEQATVARAGAEKRLLAMVGAGVAGLCVLLAVGSLALLRAITHPLHDAIQVARRIAEGDVSSPVPASGLAEMAELLHELGRMQTALSTTVGTMNTVAEQIGASSADIAGGVEDLSGRTLLQAERLDHSVQAINRLATSVQQTAELSRKTNGTVEAASQRAIGGNHAVNQVVQTMQEIRNSSRRIGDIIGVIDGIAFQTNILALNAAVEAARAGEQGRGFAVVATEVRMLAQRSAAAAREVKSLITESAQCVESGGSYVAAAGTAMAEVMETIRTVSQLMAQIDSSANEQAGDIAGVSSVLTEIESATQQNAALVQQNAIAANDLKGLADTLTSSIGQYRLT